MKTFFLLLLSLAVAFVTPVSAQTSETVIRMGDKLVIKIASVPAEDSASINNEYPVANDGTVRLPYLGNIAIKAVGRTPSELSLQIETAYKNAKIYSNPTITINPSGAMGENNRVISVQGEVKVSGDVPYRPNMTLSEAISKAGGPSDFAKMKEVKLVRNGQTTIYDMRNTTSTGKDPKVEPGDRIVVPRGTF